MTSLLHWRKLAQLGPFRWNALNPWRAGRTALGVVIPLAAGWSSGHVEYGVYMALGALPAGFASFQGETRSRAVAIAVATIGMAISTFVGATTAAAAPWLLPAIVALWAYVTGLAVCLGPAASVAILQWSVALLIAVGLPLDPAAAALRAAFVVAGGLLQAALVAASWTLRPGARERAALGGSYRALADYASRVALGTSAPPPPAALPAGSVLDDPNPLLGNTERLILVELLEQAERVRASLAALATNAGHDESAPIRELMSDAASTLGAIAGALDGTQMDVVAHVNLIAAGVARLKVDERADWRWSAEALFGELRAIVRMLRTLEPTGDKAGQRKHAPPAAPKEQGSLAGAAARLLANATTQSEAGRHALRLAVIASLAEVLVQATGLYQGRWIALTIFIVLKPDFSSTLYRGAHRALGTVLGALLALLVAQFIRGHDGWLVLASAVAAAAAYALFEVSYFLFNLPLTAFIILLLALIGMPAIANAEARVIDTIIGAALALAAYFAWPTWLGTSAQQKFASLVEGHRDYSIALLREFRNPGSVGAARLRKFQAAARWSRSDAEAAAARLADEPPHPPLTADFARLIIATVARLAHAELALHALVLSPSAGHPRGGDARAVGEFSAALTAALSAVAAALGALTAPQAVAPLRPTYTDLAVAPGLHANPIIDIADRLVDATNTLRDISRERLTPAPS